MRIVIFTDVDSLTTARLVRATLQLARAGEPGRVVGFVTTRPDSFGYGARRHLRSFARRLVETAANSEVPLRGIVDTGLDLFRLGRRHGIPVLVPPTGDPNDPAFIGELVAKVRPDLALSYFCKQRLSPRLRSVFAHAVNYHDGLCPHYRGVMATSFSIFAGESKSGFTFHHMTDRFDAGPILFQDAVSIDGDSHLRAVSHDKSRLAVAALPRLLELLAGGDPGRPQCGKGSYFSAHDWMALTHLAHPANATRGQILLRIRAFGVVHLTIEGHSYPVTRLRSSRPGERLAFRTADDKRLRPDRFWGLPALFHRGVAPIADLHP